MEFIDLAEAKRMHPLIDEKRFLGALYDPLDGYIDPASVVQAYAKAQKSTAQRCFSTRWSMPSAPKTVIGSANRQRRYQRRVCG